MVDVARLAGVSVATVSGVLGRNPNLSVTDDTRRRILDAARRTNYVYKRKRPNRNGETAASPVLVLARYGLDNPMAHDIIGGIEQTLVDVNGRMLFSVLDHEHADQFLQSFPELAGIGGAIFLSRINDVVADALKAHDIPFVLVGSSLKVPDVDMVYSDPVDYADRAAEYLVSLGHRRVCSLFSYPHYGYEITGSRFEQQVERLTGEKPLSIRYDNGNSPAAALEKVVSATLPPTAVFGNLYDVSPTLLTGPRTIPDDLSVLTMDTPGMVADRPLSFIGADNAELGREGVKILLQRIETPDRPVRHTLFPVQLHDHGSCRAIRQTGSKPKETA